MTKSRWETEGLDAARWESILAVEAGYRAGETRARGGPREAYVEVAARCNLRCKMCPITVDPAYQPGSGPGLLTPERFAALEPFFPTLERVHLFGLGEPLLNPHLFDFARRLVDHGVEVWTTTNATLIDEATAERFADAGFARVSVSIDGATAGTYEEIRRRGLFADAVAGIRHLGAVRRRRGGPVLVLSMVGMRSNLHEAPRLVELAADAGADGVFVEMLYAFDHPDIERVVREESLGHLGRERVRELLAAGRRRAGELGVWFSSRIDDDWQGELLGEAASPEEIGRARREAEAAGRAAAPAGGVAASSGPGTLSNEPPTPPAEPDPAVLAERVERSDGEPDPAALAEAVAEATGTAEPDAPGVSALPVLPRREPLRLPWPCSEPWSTINVNARGQVRTCCFNDTVFGVVGVQTAGEIWNGERYRDFRRDHLAGVSPASCDGCVRAARVKLSPHLPAPRREVAPGEPGGAAPPELAAGGRLLAPADGELVPRRLVVAGVLPEAARRSRSPLDRLRRRPEPPPRWLPEVWVGEELVARVADVGTLDGERFAAVVPLPFVHTGSHRITLRTPAETGEAAGTVLAEAQVQVGEVVDGGAAPGSGPEGRAGAGELEAGREERTGASAGALVETFPAVGRLAVAVELEAPEGEPEILLAGERRPAAAWICGTYGDAWRGIAVLDVDHLPPGRHQAELAFTDRPASRFDVLRLAHDGQERLAGSTSGSRLAS